MLTKSLPTRQLSACRGIKTVPKLYLNKFNEKMSEKTSTNELLIKFAFINNPRAGLVHWLPLGLKVLDKLRAIVNKRLKESGCEETSISILSHSELWQKTGRWNNTELFKLKDSSNQDFCLSPTSEEEITHLVKNLVTSYKDLPLTYYQIHEKFRDEKRPRMGLLRAREFLMKDAYSFDIEESQAMKTYENMVEVYHRIFQDLKIPYVKAVADSGDIGGSMSHEWHYLHPSGEDTVFLCLSCGNVSNVEKTASIPKNIEPCATKETFLKVDNVSFIKVVYPENRHLDINLLKDKYPKIAETNETPSSFVTIEDSRVSTDGIPIVSSEEGEICYECKKGELSKTKAIEVGHTFYLGTKYTKPLELTIPVPENGKLVEKHVLMGCYGIGITRILASIAEVTRDSKGLAWPKAISPWTVTVIESNTLQRDPAEAYSLLEQNQIDYALDNRSGINLGRKIKDSNMIGIPLVLILGKSFPMVEIEVRGKRYSHTWKQKHSQAEFEWEISQKAGTEKHLVDYQNASAVIQALLQDM